MSLFATTGLESSSELIAFVSSPHQDTRQRGYSMLVTAARPLAWGRPVDSKTADILTGYVEAFPRLDHFMQRLDDNSSSDLLSFSGLLDALRLVIYFLRANKRPLGWIGPKIWSHNMLLMRCLHSDDHQLMAITLALLTAVVRTGRPAAELIRESFDFSIKPLDKILFQAKRLPAGEHDRSMWSLRQVYLDLVLSLLEFGSFDTKEFVVRMRTVVASIFKLLPRDHPIMQRRVLHCFKQHILDEHCGFGPTVALFSASNIHSIVLINEECGQWTDYLRALLCVPGEGVCFPVVRPKSDADPLELRNRIALDLLPMLRPLESEVQQELAVAMLSACPDTVCPYLEAMRFNYDAVGTDRWSALMAFTAKILQSTVSPAILSPKAACDLCLLNFMPARPVMNKCLLSEDPMPKVYMITVLMELSARLHRMLSWMESRGGPDLAVRDKLVKDYLKTVPDLHTTMSVYDAVCGLPDGDLHDIVKTRMNKWVSVLLLFCESDKVDLQRALKHARQTANKDLSGSFVQVAVSCLAGLESLQLDDVCDIAVSVREVFLGYLLRVVGVPLDKARRVATWADANRREFFECLDGGRPYGELEPGDDHSSPPSPLPPPLPAPKRAKRRHYTEPDDWTPKGLFMMFGRDNVYQLLRFGLLQEDPGAEITDLQSLAGCQSLRPWLGLIAGGMAARCSIDGPFCSLQLPIVLMAMSSADGAVRKAAYGLVDQVYESLRNEDEQCWLLKEGHQIRLLLDLLRNSTDEYGQQQPLARTLFAAMAAPILCQPSHPMYPVLNRLLLNVPSLPSSGLPFFRSLAESKVAHEQCFKFLCRMYDCAQSRGESLPDWQVARLQLFGMVLNK